MTRLHPAAPAAKTLRALAGLGAVVVLAVVASGCIGGGQAPAPTPYPFSGLADRSDQAFRQGLETYGQGQYREALEAFERARLLSPSADALGRARAGRVRRQRGLDADGGGDRYADRLSAGALLGQLRLVPHRRRGTGPLPPRAVRQRHPRPRVRLH